MRHIFWTKLSNWPRNGLGHIAIRLKGPCNAELKLQNNKNRLKPYHSAEKNKAEFPEEQAWAIPPEDTPKPKPKKNMTPPENLDTVPQLVNYNLDILFIGYEWFCEPPSPLRENPSKSYSEVLQAPSPTPLCQHARGVGQENQCPIRRILLRIFQVLFQQIYPPHLPTVKGWFQLGLGLNSILDFFSAPGGSEGLESTNNWPPSADTDATGDVVAAAQIIINSLDDNSDEDSWVLVMRRQRKQSCKTDNWTAKQQRTFEQMGGHLRLHPL